ncbi:hypothetical protein HOLleu_15866 [Holothuria leucospilota]|uniref:Uncharacterized protein n=1 Tax=Holothuria leucospilota TaxID=206669 RepID=A0A9Q1C5T2_HOLLE|nr:hypothetical protein HOLleu_15866 [Holothuria leucospilota]
MAKPRTIGGQNLRLNTEADSAEAYYRRICHVERKSPVVSGEGQRSFKVSGGYVETTPISLTVYLVVCIGGALVVLILIAVTLQVVFMYKLGRHRGRHNRNQGVDNASVAHTHSGDVLVAAGSVQYTNPDNDSYYTHILDDC